MENINGVLIYWFISIGLLEGFATSVFLRNEGMSLKGNLIWGMIGAIIMGAIGIYMGIGDGLLFAFIGTLPLLFLVNVFHQHHQEDLFGEIFPAKIIRKKR
jgi:uncharacterized membrane protein YeaQ/YmgE (transglycosylase-associated protein family)